MNFLAHYYCLPQNTSPYVVCGNLMPDMFRGFSKLYNRSIKTHNSNERDAVFLLDKGIHYHIKMDKIFHGHEFFIKNEEFAKNQLENLTEVPRAYIVGHVLVELLLDQYILLNAPDYAPNFYKDLDAVTDQEIKRYFDVKKIDTHALKFLRNFNHFRSAQFLYKLSQFEGVVYALGQIFGNSLGIKIESSDELIKAINSTYDKMQFEIPGLLNEIREQLE